MTIVNDVRVERLTEQFSVSLSSLNEDTRIRVNTQPSTVVIMDDDGMNSRKLATCSYTPASKIIMTFPTESVVSLERSVYRVRESIGKIQVCARVVDPRANCPIRIPFSVSLSTRDNTAGIYIYIYSS